MIQSQFPFPTGGGSVRPGRRESRKGTYKGEVKLRYSDEMKFQNVPCALGFEVKHSKIFCISFRTCMIILSMYSLVNNILAIMTFKKIKHIFRKSL